VPTGLPGDYDFTPPFNRVIALDPESGIQKWTFDPLLERQGDYGDGLINRGLATWVDPARRAGEPCRRRLFEATLDARLIALDAATGSPCADFGQHGQISLRGVSEYQAGSYHMTSPPAVIDGLVIVGSAINDNGRARTAAGVVRAFDARTGAIKWSWDPMPAGTSAGRCGQRMVGDGGRRGAPSGFLVPTGSASPDYYEACGPATTSGRTPSWLRSQTGDSHGVFSSSITIWDYDTASPPLLASISHNGRSVPVVIQGNKTGFLYVLDRDSGAPVRPVEERPVPQSDVPGEVTSPTQPFPTASPPVVLQRVSADDMWGPDRDACLAYMRDLRNDGIFTPPSLKGTLVMPGNLGGMNWSGSAFDPTRHLLVVSERATCEGAPIPRAEFNDRSTRTEDGDYETSRHAIRHVPAVHSGPVRPVVQQGAGVSDGDRPRGRHDHGRSHSPDAGLRRIDGDDRPGSISVGGPIVTAGGLSSLAARSIHSRAFDIDRPGCERRAAGGGHAMPMTYQITERPAVVVAVGGHAKISEESVGDAPVAFVVR
jgi:quinoprotein glucose dehydrogenase